MSTIKRYFEVIGDGIEQIEALKAQRLEDKRAAQALAEEHGFQAFATANGINGERVIGLVMPFAEEGGAEQHPNERYWKRTDVLKDGRGVWLPKRTSKWGKEISARIRKMPITDRQDMVALFGLRGWEVMSAVGRSLSVAHPTCGELAGHWVVLVPESPEPDGEQFSGHEWLWEITVADYREYQAMAERAKEEAA